MLKRDSRRRNFLRSSIWPSTLAAISAVLGSRSAKAETQERSDMRERNISYEWDRPALTETEIHAQLFKARVPAIAMLATPQATDTGTPGCWFGGEPTLPAAYDWPVFTNPYAPFEGFSVPMHFLVQINLQYVPRVVGLPSLPPSGTLFVFYDPIAAPMSPGRLTDPEPLQTGLGVRVIFHPGDVTGADPRKMPQLPDLTTIEDQMIYDETWLAGDRSYPFDFVVVDDFVRVGDVRGEAHDIWLAQNTPLLSVQGWTRYSKPRVGPAHEFSYPTIFGATHDPIGPSREEREREGLPDHPTRTDDEDVLLFRDLGTIAWGDETSSFWIKRSDLKNEDFSKVSIWLEER